MGALNIPIIHARRVLSIAGRRIFLRKFCQNLQNAQFFRPKTGILPVFLPSAAGQNFDTFSILHTVERGESLQGREKIGDVPLPSSPAQRPVNPVRPLSQALSGLPALPKGEPRALPEASSLHLKLQQRALRLGSPFGGAGAGAPERASLSPQRLFFLHRNVLLIMVY